MMRNLKYSKWAVFAAMFATLYSCRNSRIHEKPEWSKYFEAYGIAKANSCFELNDHNHESVYYYNLDRCSERFLPASTFKIFNSLAALESAVASDDQLVIKWDSVPRRPEWDKDMTMGEAFKVSCVPYYQEIARRIGAAKMQHYLDTVKYGNMDMGGSIDQFWLNDSLKISGDEQVGFLKRMYFCELPMSERTQRIVKVMMLQEQTPEYNLYYKTGTGKVGNRIIYMVCGFAERIEKVKEPKESMNKSDERYYPYFFSENFEITADAEKAKDWGKIRMDLLHDLLHDAEVLPKR
jgi:beta-lactamase class D